MTDDELFSYMNDNVQLFKYFSMINKEYQNRFKLYRNYLEFVKGSTILNQNFLKISKNKIEKLVKKITRDEITLIVLHFLENSKFSLTIFTNNHKYSMSLEGENFLKSSYAMIKSKILKNDTTKFLKEYNLF